MQRRFLLCSTLLLVEFNLRKFPSINTKTTQPHLIQVHAITIYVVEKGDVDYKIPSHIHYRNILRLMRWYHLYTRHSQHVNGMSKSFKTLNPAPTNHCLINPRVGRADLEPNPVRPATCYRIHSNLTNKETVNRANKPLTPTSPLKLHQVLT